MLGASDSANPQEAHASLRGEEACRIDFRCPWTRTGRRLRPAAEASESHKGGSSSRARAKDVGLLWLYLLYKVRAQLISQAA